jgi:serine/threonine-protein kinase
MAPEMVTGKGKIDGRSDIYSLGCVAYWMLTGELVFSGGTPMQTAFAHANTIPDPPSSRTELPVPRELEAVIMTCLAKDPRERPASANDLAARLEGSVAARWTPDRARTWWGTHLPDLLAVRPRVSPAAEAPTTVGPAAR